MITIFNIIVSIIGALALGFVFIILSTPDMKTCMMYASCSQLHKVQP